MVRIPMLRSALEVAENIKAPKTLLFLLSKRSTVKDRFLNLINKCLHMKIGS